MKLGLLAAALVIAASPTLAADPLEGTWLTAKDDNGRRGVIQVAPCGANLCGVLVRAIDTDGSNVTTGENIGRQIIWNTASKGNGVYRGKVYSPDRDKTYNSKLVLSGNSLSVSGCVLGACREGGVWTRQ